MWEWECGNTSTEQVQKKFLEEVQKKFLEEVLEEVPEEVQK